MAQGGMDRADKALHEFSDILIPSDEYTEDGKKAANCVNDLNVKFPTWAFLPLKL